MGAYLHRIVLAAALAVVLVATAAAKKPPPPPPPPPPPAAAVLKTAVVLINFTNDLSQPYTVQQIRGVAFDAPDSAARFLLEASYGKRTLAGDVFGWWTVPYPNSSCDTGSWKAAAAAMALARGVNLDSYDHVALVWPWTAACPFGGRAGSFFNGTLDGYGLAHEIGHSFFLNHSGVYRCAPAADGSYVYLAASGCTADEYGDIYDVMGSGYRHFNGWEKARLGWLTNVQIVAASGRYSLSPLEWQPQPSPQLLLVQRRDGTVLTLERRAPYGVFDTANYDDPFVTGVLMRVASEMPGVHSQTARTVLIDANNVTAFAEIDAAFQPGQTFVDPLGGLTVTVVTVTPSAAVVDVQVTP